MSKLLLLFFILTNYARAETTPRELNAIYRSARSLITSNSYVHSWIPMPALKGQGLNGADLTFTPASSHVAVYIFIASWCVQCQTMMDYFKELEQKYAKLNTDFVYVFSHDLVADANGFYKQYNLTSPAIVASHEILKAYHNPDLPAVYLGDRNGFLQDRFLKIDTEKTARIDALLFLLTAY